MLACGAEDTMHETDERFLDRLADECAQLLGPGLAVAGIEQETVESGVRLTLIVGTPAGPTTIVSSGTSIVDAAGQLVARLPEERLVLAFRRLVAEEGYAKQRG
jgi:hypothetical protein